jgi:hypothetical protein
MVNVYHLVFAESIDYYLAHVLVQKQAVIDEAMNIFPEGTIDLASLSAEVAEQEVLIKAAQEEAKAKIPAMPSFSKNVPEIAAVEKEYILQMLRYLAGVCDGAARRDGHGFNKFDAQFGRGMAGFENLTDRQALFAKKLLVKYRKQLSMVFPAHVIDLSFSETFMAQFGGDQAELI